MTGNLLLLPRIQVQNANALSSPYTIGFPAMTAWLGAVHALQRKLNATGIPITFPATGVVVHDFNLQTYKGHGDFVYSIIGTGNPLEPKTEKGKPKGNAVRPSFIEEARCHLTASLLVEYDGIEAHEEASMLAEVHQLVLGSLKMAGGDIITCEAPEIIRDFSSAKQKTMPGYALIERKDLMQSAMAEGQDAIDAMLDYLSVHHSCTTQHKDGEEQVSWQSQRKPTGSENQRGWIVPVAVGFQGISELGNAKNQRDPETPHRFAESVITLGEFKMPYRLRDSSELLWRYHVDQEHELYLCLQESNTEHEDY